MTEPWNCDICVYGKYSYENDEWGCSLDINDEDECKAKFVEDDRS